MSTFVQDCRYAARMFAANRASTTIAILTLTIAIGLNTAIYSVVHRLLVRPLPFPAADRLSDVALSTAEARGIARFGQMPTYGAYRAWREQSTTFDGLAAYDVATPVLSPLGGNGAPERVSVAAIDARVMPLIGAIPAMGRTFAPEEDVRAVGPPAILSGRFWASRFGRDPNVVGRVVVLDGRPHHVIGVMPEAFRFPVLPPEVGGTEAQLWIPLASAMPSDPAVRDKAAVWVVGRTRPGVTASGAAADLDRITKRGGIFQPDEAWTYAQVTPLRDFVVGGVRRPLLLMQGAALFVLLVACANTANLLLARGVARQREFTVRAALGAGRGRLVRQLVTESVLLALVAGTAAVLLAIWSVPALVRLGGAEIPELGRMRVDAGALGAAFLATAVTGILFGLAPAVHAWRASSLVPGSGARGGGWSRTQRRMTDGLVVAEVALTMVLLSGAGILVHSFVRLMRVDLGFVPDRVLVAELSLPKERYPSAPEQLAFADAAVRATRAISGISAAAVSTSSPFAGGGFSVVTTPGTKTKLGHGPAWLVAATPDYFRVLQIPQLRGQPLDPAAPTSILVDEAGARDYFPGADPIGQSLAWRGNRSRGTVVGVVRGVRQDSPKKSPPHIYMPLAGGVTRSLQVIARTEGDPRRYEAALRQAITGIDRTLVVERVSAMGDLLGESRAQQRFYMLLLATFAGCALLIAVGGIYATVNAVAAGSVRELAIRAALGARRSTLFGLVVRRGLILTALGCAIGLAGALATTRLLTGLLFDVRPADPWTFGIVLGVLGLASFVASYVPGRRAMRADPMAVLQGE
jgi:predicted permease